MATAIADRKSTSMPEAKVDSEPHRRDPIAAFRCAPSGLRSCLSTRRAGATDVEADTPPESDQAHDAQPRTFVLDAPRRRHRRAHGRCRGSAEGHGLCDGRGAVRQRRALHRVRSLDRLRAHRDVARAERQLDDDAGDPHRCAARIGGPRRRSRQAHGRSRDADRADRRAADRRVGPPARISREFHIDARAHRLQGWHRAGHRARPSAEAGRHSHHQAGLLP